MRQFARVERGFSLIELMVAVAIIGVLVSIAVPAYQDHIRKARKAAAQAFVAEVAAKQGRYLLNVRRYAVTWAELNVSVPADITPYYSIPGPGGDNAAVPPVYAIVATPVAGGGQESLGTLEYHSDGRRIGGW